MNCTKIEKLIPLYVGEDLSSRESAALAAHLSSCDGCRALLEEFEASRERLTSFAVPEFGAEFYEQMRRSVMQQINASPAQRPSLLAALRDLFPVRPALAASLATLALFCALSFVIYRSLVKDEPRLAAIDEILADFSFEMPSVDEVRPISNGNISDGVSRLSFTARNNSRRRVGRATVERVPPEASPNRTVDATGSNAEQASAQTSGATAQEASRQAIARMDIQTSDPNIRIIWLARKPSE